MIHLIVFLLHAYTQILRAIFPVVPLIWAGATGWFARAAYQTWKTDRELRHLPPPPQY